MLTPLKLFTCTLSAKFEIKGIITELAEHLEPQGSILAINSNFAHKAQPGYEQYLKAPKEPTMNRSGKGHRKRQGDGSCFRSSIEFIVKIDHSEISKNKVYKPKLYPGTGEIQVPGVIVYDFSDGITVIETLASFLNQNILVPGNPIMLNYRCVVSFNSPQELLNLQKISEYIRESDQSDLPYPLLETHVAVDGTQALTVRFKIGEKIQRVSIWRSGKINITGAKYQENAIRLYDYFNLILDLSLQNHSQINKK